MEEVEADVGFVQIDVDLFRFGHDGDGRGGGVDTSLRFGLGDALDAVDAGLVLEPREGTVAFDLADDFLEAAHGVLGGAEHVGAPAPSLGVADVGSEKIGGPESGFVAAGAGPDFNDHVAVVVGVARQECALGVFLEPFDLFPQFRHFREREFAHLFVVGLVEHLTRLLELVGGGAVLVEQVDLALQRRVLSRQGL